MAIYNTQKNCKFQRNDSFSLKYLILQIAVIGTLILIVWYICLSSEILRVIDSLQMTDKNLVATPADWKV